MGKRSTFERKPRDFYETPKSAVLPLIYHLRPQTRFIEPCAGAGKLVSHLEAEGMICAGAWDICPQNGFIQQGDALELGDRLRGCDYIITNPPWGRPLLHEMIVNFSDHRPTWLLFDADWIHTRQAAPYLSRLRKIVSVGRVKWIEDSKHTGKDNCCWYLFSAPSQEPTRIVGRIFV